MFVIVADHVELHYRHVHLCQLFVRRRYRLRPLAPRRCVEVDTAYTVYYQSACRFDSSCIGAAYRE